MNIRNRNGQSLVECVICLPLLLGLWVAIVWFARVFIIQIELMHTARYAVFALVTRSLESRDEGEESAAASECYAFLRRQDPSLDFQRLQIHVEPGASWKPSSLIKKITSFKDLIGIHG